MSRTTKTDHVGPLALLSGVREVFSRTLDYNRTLTALARLALPYLGSWCAIDVFEQDGSLRRLVVSHPDPEKERLANGLALGWPPERDHVFGAPAVIATRQSVLIPHVSDELLVKVAGTQENLRMLRDLGIGSVITVPMVAHDAVLGALTFVSAASGHQYDERDVSLAEGLAALAALAVDNARLHGEALVRAEAESANRTKTDFLAIMSHEMRTPVNAILGYAELLDLELAGSLSTGQRDFVVRLRRTGVYLAELITNILDLAKADAGKLSVDTETASASGAVATALVLTRPAADAAGIHVIDVGCGNQDETTGVEYIGDEQRVGQIITNLVTNAVKFTPRGGTVTVSCGRSMEGWPSEYLRVKTGPWAFVRVPDTGNGVPIGREAAVFEPFVQGEAGFTRSTGGTGLGLTISRELARLMGGDLTLTSSADRTAHGATFTLWLPAAADAQANKSDVTSRDNVPIPLLHPEPGAYRVYGLAEIALHIRGRIEEVLKAVAEALRSDPVFGSAADLSVSELEDHQFAFLADVVQSLIVIDDTGGVVSSLYRDGSEIQRVVSRLHGRMRQRQGWSAHQLDRESAIVLRELEALIERHTPAGVGDVKAAVAVIRHLVEQARVESTVAHRQSAPSEVA